MKRDDCLISVISLPEAKPNSGADHGSMSALAIIRQPFEYGWLPGCLPRPSISRGFFSFVTFRVIANLTIATISENELTERFDKTLR